MPENNPYYHNTPPVVDETQGAHLDPYFRIGVIKSTDDVTRTGTLRVFLRGTREGLNEDDDRNWVPVQYVSPFWGATTAEGPNSGYGDYKSNPQSYGWWATIPDVGTEIICGFVNGDRSRGIYIGSVPRSTSHNMVPAVAPASSTFVPTEGQAASYGGADRLPVSEINTNNKGLVDSPTFYNTAKPIHATVAKQMFEQGVLRDTIRGPISSSSQRETPSRVFGVSTPGPEIYEGGMTRADVRSRINSGEDSTKFKVVGRIGGHSLVMDDGTIDGLDQLIRLRTVDGHQIMMNDSGQTITIIHKNGDTWLELNGEGAIDVYAKNSINFRTLGDLNFHSDQHINMHAAKEFRVRAESIGLESVKGTTIRAGTTLHTSSGTRSQHRSGEDFNIYAQGQTNIKADNDVNIKGRNIHLNTNGAQVVDEVAANKPKIYPDTVRDGDKGWISSPLRLESITTRVTSHLPMPDFNGTTGGVVAKIDQSAEAGPKPSTETASAINASGTSTDTPVSSTTMNATQSSPIASTALSGVASNGPMSSSQLATAVSAQVSKTAGMDAATKLAQGVLPTGVSTLAQAAAGGILKPGSDIMALRSLNQGLPMSLAVTQNMMTGAQGASTPAQLISGTVGQVTAAAASIQTAAKGLEGKGLIAAGTSAQAIVGPALAAAQSGVTAVSSAIASGSITSSSAIGSAIALGTQASKMTDMASAAVAGVTGSLTGLAGGLAVGLGSAVGALGGTASATLGSIGSALKGSLGGLGGMAQTMLDTAKAAIPNLKANVPNNTDGAPPEQNPNYETNFQFEGQTYNTDPDNPGGLNNTSSSTAAVSVPGAAQSGLSALPGIAQSINVVGMATTAVSGALSSINSLISGGSQSAIQNIAGGSQGLVQGLMTQATGAIRQVTSTAGSLADSVAGAAQSLIGASNSTSAVKSLSSLSGGLLGGLGSKLSQVPGAASAVSAGLSAKLLGGLGSVGNLPGDVKAPQVAVGTSNDAGREMSNKSLVGEGVEPVSHKPVTDTKKMDDTYKKEIKQQLEKAIDEATVAGKRFTAVKRIASEIIDKFDNDDPTWSDKISNAEKVAEIKSAETKEQQRHILLGFLHSKIKELDQPTADKIAEVTRLLKIYNETA